MGQSWVILETPGGRPGVSVRCVGAIFGPPGASWGRLWGRGILGESWAPGLFGAKKCERLQHLKKTQGFFNMFGLSGASWGASCRRLVAFGLPLGSWAMVAAFRGYLGSHLGRLGDLGDRFDGVWVPEELGEVGCTRDGGAIRKSTAILPDSAWHYIPLRSQGDGGGSIKFLAPTHPEPTPRRAALSREA